MAKGDACDVHAKRPSFRWTNLTEWIVLEKTKRVFQEPNSAQLAEFEAFLDEFKNAARKENTRPMDGGKSLYNWEGFPCGIRQRTTRKSFLCESCITDYCRILRSRIICSRSGKDF